jgi:hypothetical protein
MVDEYTMYENALRSATTSAEMEKVKNIQQEVMLASQDKSMIQQQLDLGDELERIDYLLRGYSIEKDKETGETIWKAPDDEEMVILSPFGVHLIRNTIAWYVNKDTLLSNYDEDTILHKMEDFASDLNDTVFMEYEKVFQYPTLEDCKKIFDSRIENKKNIKIYAMELLGKKLDDKQKQEIEDDILRKIEPVIEKELEKIKSQLMKNKLKRFMLLIRQVQDLVHSTYNRAYMGQERKTLREHIHISETKGGNLIQPDNRSGILSYFKKK